MVSGAFSTDFPSCGAPDSCPFRLSFLASICPLPVSILPTSLSSYQSVFATDNSWFRLECPAVWCRSCVKFNLFCPAFHRSSAVVFDPGGTFSVPVDFSTLRAFFFFFFPECRDLPWFHIQHYIRLASPFFGSSFLFSFLSSYLVVGALLF